MVNLLFDYDGTLHDSLQIYAPAFQEAYDWLAERGCVAPRTWSLPEIRQWIGLSPKEMWDRFQPDLPEEEKGAASTLIGKRMLELIRAGEANLYPGVPEVLEALRGEGYRLLLLSNCPVVYLQAHTDCFGLDRLFDGLYCGEQFGYQPKYEILPKLRARWRGEFVIIGDRAQDMEIAARHSLPVVGCLYGYGSREELSAADRLIQFPAELPAAVRQLAPI